jgi:hypothetical protein
MIQGIYERIQRTWDAQSLMKQDVVLALLNGRVKNQAGFEDRQIEELYAAIPNPYKDSFEDVESCIDELPAELQDRVRARLRESRMDSGSSHHGLRRDGARTTLSQVSEEGIAPDSAPN